MRYIYLILAILVSTSLFSQDYDQRIREVERRNKKSKADIELPPISQVPQPMTLYDMDGSWAYQYSGVGNYLEELEARAEQSGGKVALIILDTGTPTHRDLQTSRLSQYDRQFADNGVDGNGHSTHVGGIVASERENVGICKFAVDMEALKVIYVEVLDDNGSGSYTNVGEGYFYVLSIVAELQAQGFNVVVNASLGGGGYSDFVADAIQQLQDMNVVVNVIAAGNESAYQLSFPASVPGVLSVGAFDENEVIASFSNQSPNLKLSAPGVAILSCWLNDNYAQLSGTSMAAPYISALQTIAWILYPDATANQIKRLLVATAKDLGVEGRDGAFGYGVPTVYPLLINDPYGLPDTPLIDEVPELPTKRKRNIYLTFRDYKLMWKPYNSIQEYRYVNLDFEIKLKTNLYAEDAYRDLKAVLDLYFRTTGLWTRADDDFIDAGHWGRHFLAMYLRREGYDFKITRTIASEGEIISDLQNYNPMESLLKVKFNPEVKVWYP